MPDRWKIAAVQMCSSEDKQANLQQATKLVEEAAAAGADFVALPEMFNCLGRFEQMVAVAEPIPGPTSEAMGALAKRLGIVLLAGTICEATDQAGRAYNASLLIDRDGQPLSIYRKIHLFDIELTDQVQVCESNFIVGGSDIVCTQTDRAMIGQSICYDLRFPELFRSLADAGAELIALPAAFTKATGEHHWKVLLRSRAIENQAFVIAPNQFGAHTPKLISYGHSMIIDPWGNVMAELDGDSPGIALAEIDFDQMHRIREQLPALTHRRGLERKLD